MTDVWNCAISTVARDDRWVLVYRRHHRFGVENDRTEFRVRRVDRGFIGTLDVLLVFGSRGDCLWDSARCVRDDLTYGSWFVWRQYWDNNTVCM